MKVVINGEEISRVQEIWNDSKQLPGAHIIWDSDLNKL